MLAIYAFHRRIVAGGPVVSSVTPDAGRSSGGETRTISGSGFLGATGITFGGVPATGVTVVNDTTITCTVPAGTVGSSAAVAVTTPGGTGTLPGAYYYLDATALELWFRADIGVTQAANRVSAWANQSGSADANRNLVQGTGANQPRLVATNSAFANRPTVGTLTTSDEDLSMQSGTFAAAIGTTATVYHVLRIPSGLGNNVALRWGLGTYANAPSFVVDTGMTSYQSNDGTNLLQTAGVLAAGTVYVVCSIYNGASGQTFLSRHTTAAATGNAGSTSMNTLRIGTIAGFATRYETAEIIAYSGAHAQAKRQEVMTYLGARYGVTITA